jgi:hypothetical protein
MSVIRKTAVAVVLALAAVLPVRAGDAEKYLPDGANSVISINVRQFLDSALIKKAALDKALAGDDEAQKVLKDLGLDPFKDVERVVSVSGPGDDQTLLIFEGKFDPAKFEAKADEVARDQKDQLEIHKTSAGKVYEVKNISDLLPALPAQAGGVIKNKSLFVAVADKSTVVVSPSKAAAGEVLDKAAGKKTTKLKSKELAALLGKMDPKQTVALAVPGNSDGADKVKSITGGLTVAADVKIDVNVAATDADAAASLTDEIKTQLDKAQGIAAAIAPLKEALDAIKVEAKDKNIAITGTIKGDTLERLAKVLAALVGQGG